MKRHIYGQEVSYFCNQNFKANNTTNIPTPNNLTHIEMFCLPHLRHFKNKSPEKNGNNSLQCLQ